MAAGPVSVEFLISFSLLFMHIIKGDVQVESNGFTSYTRTQSTEKFNVFRVEFKTLQPTGLLLHAKGAKDFVTLELIKGKLRYAADFGNTMDAYGEWISGYHEHFVGVDLANNDWHTIILAHSELTRRVYITLDKNRETEYKTSRTIPPISADFSIEYVHVGGMKGIESLSKQESLSQKGIKGCFRNTTINAKSLLDGKDVTLVDAKISKCPSLLHLPIDFPAKDSYMSFNYSMSSLVVGFGLKTNVPDQFLVSYDSSNKQQLLTVKLDVVGRVIAEIDGQKLVSSNTQHSGLHDSYWHQIEISVSENPNNFELTVDGKKSSLTLNRKFLNDGMKVFFGKGFVGCMRNLVVGTTKISADNTDLYAASDKLLPLFGKCSLREHCVPEPCMNGGVCQQKIGHFTCDCSNTGHQGPVCSQPLYSKSCDALKLKRKIKTTDGVKTIDIDGTGPLPKMQVFCEYKSSGTVTKIATTLAQNVAVENRFGSKSLKIEYEADKRSIKALVGESLKCRQHVEYVCTKSALFQSPKGPSKVRWVGPNYNYHYYWGGSDGRAMNCRCGVYNNCSDTSKHCNCDARAATQAKDEGFLVDKKHLPMHKVEFLDVNSNEGSKGQFSIGPLICSGDASKSNAVSFRDSQAHLALKPTSITDYNSAIQILSVSFTFKTTLATGTLLSGIARSSSDFIKIHIQSKTKLRAELNLGSETNFVDVDIAATKAVFDDNKAHTLEFMFNRVELTLVVDSMKKTKKLNPLSSTHLNLDGEPFVLGGGYGITQGFIGCIQGFFLNGHLVDIAKQGRFQESYGVYVGCGIGCARPSSCNSGKCVEYYSSFACDCSLSAYDGKYCHKESYPLHFGSEKGLTYVFDKRTQIKEGRIMTAFKTDHENGLIFSLHGDNPNCHITLVIQNGELKLLYNFDITTSSYQTMKIATGSGKTLFNDGKLYSLRITHNGKRVLLQLLDGKSKMQQQDIKSDDTILSAVTLSVASISMPLLPLTGMPNSFNGCISAFKYSYYTNSAAKPLSLDIFAMYSEGKGVKGNGEPGKCGKPLPTPAPLPKLLNRPTKAPDKMLPIPGSSSVMDDDMSVIVIAAACALGLLLILVIVLFCRHINRNLGAYKTNEDRRPLSTEHEMTVMPPSEAKDGGRVSSEPDSPSGEDGKTGKKKEWYV